MEKKERFMELVKVWISTFASSSTHFLPKEGLSGALAAADWASRVIYMAMNVPEEKIPDDINGACRELCWHLYTCRYATNIAMNFPKPPWFPVEAISFQ